ncbi:MAG TPA: bifunctional adenosylcobinamide kinase/adenosylcobinamide-phosphate guanylyltransferase [Candidatus Eisenbacteria bacterium]|nr:bifunctional adenosylcobinamide kinase/adenosylcobinamide-phosphate guanylyltransferase [Candidatus Eisenbacteria bacterium]
MTDQSVGATTGVILVLGGTASGKSRHAVQLARQLAAEDVTFIATARTGDPELDRRITRHRGDRPATWETLEAADDLAGSIESAAPDRLLLVDSLGLWVATTLDDGGPIDSAWLPVERAIRARVPGVVLVSDEVGLSPVALTELGRRFVDALGWTNQRAAEIADEVRLVIAGLPVRIKP